MWDPAHERVLVLGLGLTGRSAANYCAARGAAVVAADEREAASLPELAKLDERVERRVGSAFPDPADFDLVVPSPGVPAQRYRARARRVWGDVELAWRALSIPIVAVTGTNGKSTTTVLVEAMLRAAGFRARAAGNIGIPVLELVGEPLDVAVMEVSSFQLETTESFRPSVAVILNITDDHLDRHGDFAAYARAKARLLAHQGADDAAVLNFDDPEERKLAAQSQARVIPFRTAGPLREGAWIDSGALVYGEGKARVRISLDGLNLRGRHLLEDVAAALAASAAAGADPSKAASALIGFRGLPHRMEVLAEVAGVTYVNDSKATNAGAALCSLQSFSEPLVWIAGGRDKGLDFAALARVAGERVRAALLLGEAAPKLAEALAGLAEVQRVASIEEAVARAARIARAGDVVLLSPACASLDQFRSFEERGDRFRAAVAGLGAGNPR